MSDLRFGGTDCALPMRYAIEREREVDAFVIYTDSETWAGDIDPVQALREYRERSGIAARLVVVGMISNGFTIADPDDPGHARRRRLRHRHARGDLRVRERVAVGEGRGPEPAPFVRAGQPVPLPGAARRK